MEQYRLLAECFLPEEILNQFELKDVEVEIKTGAKVLPSFTPSRTPAAYTSLAISDR